MTVHSFGDSVVSEGACSARVHVKLRCTDPATVQCKRDRCVHRETKNPRDPRFTPAAGAELAVSLQLPCPPYLNGDPAETEAMMLSEAHLS